MKRTKFTLLATAILLAAAAFLQAEIPPATPGSATTGPGGDLRMAGQTEPVAKVEVPAGMRGQLASVDVKQGQLVKKGDPLAKLDDSLQTKQVELAKLEAESDVRIKAAQVTLDSKRNEYDRIKSNPAAGSAEILAKELEVKQTELALELARNEQKVAQVKLDQEKITLEKMTIRSPIGAVLRVNKQAGEETDDNPLVVVVQVNKLNAVFYPPKQLFGKVKVGDKFTLEFATDPVTKRDAVVVAVDPTIEQSLFQVKFELDNADAKVPAGTAATWIWTAK